MHNIAIFDTFKTKDQLTGKAKRQRKIIKIINDVAYSSQRTKVEISKKISAEYKQSWKNTYSGVYEDIENALLPHGIIEKEGQIPLKRGPRSLQKEGTSFYKLTKTGVLLLYCIEEGKMDLDFTEFTSELKLGEELNQISKISPILCYLLLEKLVSTYCKKGLEIMPLTLEKLGEIYGSTLDCDLEFIMSILSCDKQDQKIMLDFLANISSKH